MSTQTLRTERKQNKNSSTNYWNNFFNKKKERKENCF